MGTISMDPHLRFPLVYLGHGTSNRCLQKYQDDGSCFMLPIDGGWCNDTTMELYLPWLSQQMDGHPLAFVLDVFIVHQKQNIKEFARQLNIELIYVPANATGMYQPLNRRIFGIFF